MVVLPHFNGTREKCYNVRDLLRVLFRVEIMPFKFDEFPPKIIRRVFKLCCGSVAFVIPPHNKIGPGTTQVTLSLVCSRWRAIPLNTSTLWNDVMVYYNGNEEPDHGPTASFRFVQNWLNRAGMTPISLSISAYEALEQQIDAISRILLSSYHITNLDLETVECDHLLLPTDNLHYLERLNLTMDELVVQNDAFPMLPEMPSLKELQLCLDLRLFRDFMCIYLMPWHQLRVFTVVANPWPSQMLLGILQRCKSLIECTLVVNLQNRQREHGVVLPILESLVLEIDSKGRADPLIRSLTLPNLRLLDIRSSMEVMELSLNPEAIVIMAQRSGFNKRLTSFSLCLTKQPVDVRLLLGSMPALERVQLHGPLMFQSGTFDDLSSGTIGPQLEEIRFGDMSDEEIELLLETVGQRHEKAKTVSDIRPFASVTCCTDGSELKSHKRQAKQCSEAFNTDVAIVSTDDFPETLSDTVEQSDE